MANTENKKCSIIFGIIVTALSGNTGVHSGTSYTGSCGLCHCSAGSRNGSLPARCANLAARSGDRSMQVIAGVVTGIVLFLCCYAASIYLVGIFALKF